MRRINSDELWIPEAGWALITQPDRWERLWRDYGKESYPDDGSIRVPRAPAVDFSRTEVLAVSFGPTSGCGNRVRLVERVIDAASDRVAVVTPDYSYTPRLTCGMIVEPVDLVLLPRSSKPVRLRLMTSRKDTHWKLPAPASWWVALSAQAARDSGTTPLQRRAYEVSRRVLPRDSTLPVTEYRLLAAGAYDSHDWLMHRKLIRNPRAMADKTVVAWLAADPRVDDVQAVRLDFIARFGLDVASDSEAPYPWLQALIELLTDAATVGPDHKPRHPSVAQALARSPTILGDSLRAERLTYAVQWYPDVHLEVCRAYRQRYPRTLTLERDSTRTPRSTLVANCPLPIGQPR